MYRFLRFIGVCGKARAYSGLTPTEAWKKAVERGEAANLPRQFHHTDFNRCWCASNKPRLPPALLSAYRRFK